MLGQSSVGVSSACLRRPGKRSVGLSSVCSSSAGLSSVGLSSVGLICVGLGSVGHISVSLSSVGLSSVGLRSVHVQARVETSQARLLGSGPCRQRGRAITNVCSAHAERRRSAKSLDRNGAV